MIWRCVRPRPGQCRPLPLGESPSLRPGGAGRPLPQSSLPFGGSASLPFGGGGRTVEPDGFAPAGHPYLLGVSDTFHLPQAVRMLYWQTDPAPVPPPNSKDGAFPSRLASGGTGAVRWTNAEKHTEKSRFGVCSRFKRIHPWQNHGSPTSRNESSLHVGGGSLTPRGRIPHAPGRKGPPPGGKDKPLPVARPFPYLFPV